MIQVSITEAQQQLPELLEEAGAGNDVEIQADNGRTYRLVASHGRLVARGIPKAGTCEGLIVLADDFDAPLEELREYWE